MWPAPPGPPVATVPTEAAPLPVDRTHRWLSQDAYWSLGRSRETVERSLEHSVNFGAYEAGPEGPVQVGFLRIVTDALVERIVIENGRAVGIDVRIGGESKRIHAAREVVIAAGTVGSPRILQLSGLGSAAHLRSLGIPGRMEGLTPLYRGAIAAERIPVIANLAISNVPGPQMKLYLAGMEMKAYYPVSIVTHGLGLNVTIVSYNGSLDFGLVSARSAMPDLRKFARHLEAAHRELLKTTQVKMVSDTKSTRKKKK